MKPDGCYRLLVVDDDQIDRQRYARLLHRKAPHGYRLESASDGATGLALLQDATFDCVLLDYGLPDMTGLEFLIDAAAGSVLPFAVVLITGRGNEAIAVEAMKRGAQDYLVKEQVNENSLWRAVTQAILQKQLRLRLDQSLRDLEQEVAIREATEIELRAAKVQADEANLAKTRFVAMVTHELRTPLNGVLGYAQLLRMEQGLSATQERRVDAMIEAGQHLRAMIEQVLDFASIETGHATFDPQSIAVAELCQRCLDVIAPVAAERMLTLRLTRAADTPTRIVLDPARLQQVLLNLLGNAVKFTASGEVELRLSAGSKPHGLRLEVVDTGHGIAEDKRGLLFQDFERLGAAASVEGTGLGLALVSRIAARMGGAVGYAPNPAGGSIFWVDLPSAEPPTTGTALPVAAPAQSAGRTILLVDDLAMNRDVIGAFLRAGGYHVLLANGGEEAVSMVRDGRVELVLMDVRMPGVDGLEATRRIRALSGAPASLPILALTAYSCRDQVARCLDAGMDGHVTKPVDHVELLRKVGETLANRASGEPAEDETEHPAPLRFDRDGFELTFGFVETGHELDTLRGLRDRMGEMDRLLDGACPLQQVIDAAHGLASTSGMFGFLAVSAAARGLEQQAAGRGSLPRKAARALRAEAIAARDLLEPMIEQRERTDR